MSAFEYERIAGGWQVRSATTPALVFSATRCREKRGAVRGTLRIEGVEEELPQVYIVTDTFNFTNAGARKRMVTQLVGKGVMGADDKPLVALETRWHEEFRRRAAAPVSTPVSRGGQAGRGGQRAADGQDDDLVQPARVPQAEQLVSLAMASGVELFHTPDREAYATMHIEGHDEHWRLSAKGFRQFLQHRFYQETAGVPRAQALQEALGVLGGKAVFEGDEHETPLRLAERDGTIYLDLGTPDWSTVKITPGRWEVVDSCPVRFRRTPGMRPLPVPARGGTLAPLRAMINLPDTADGERSWRLMVAWLLAAFRPARPYPILLLRGEQGSAKSTAGRMLRRLVDPNHAALRTAPRTEHDMVIAAHNGWIVAYDNLSRLPVWLSDALCRMATGGGFGTRALYTNEEEALFDVMRPIIVNGIDEFATRGDFLDRSLTLVFPCISPRQRKTEEELWAEFDAQQPMVLGAVLTAFADALDILPDVPATVLPRMADFARFGLAVERALAWEPGSFLEACGENRQSQNSLALEDALIAPLIIDAAMGTGFSGTAGELLKQLDQKADETTVRRPGWPKNPKALSDMLARLAPNFRETGIEIRRERASGKTRRRLLQIRAMPEGDSPRKIASPAFPVSDGLEKRSPALALPVEGWMQADASRTKEPGETNAEETSVSDAKDAADADMHSSSFNDEDEVVI